jgi:hypothetical protein
MRLGTGNGKSSSNTRSRHAVNHLPVLLKFRVQAPVSIRNFTVEGIKLTPFVLHTLSLGEQLLEELLLPACRM